MLVSFNLYSTEYFDQIIENPYISGKQATIRHQDDLKKIYFW